MSISSLPTELLRQIIESNVPASFRFASYSERQYALRSLCLVSRRFCAIAQPLLLEIVWVSPRKLNRTVDLMELKGWYNEMLEVVCSDEVGGGIAQSPFDRLAQDTGNLRTLVLRSQSGELDLAPLKQLRNLSQLRLFGNGFSLSSPFTNSNLESLTLSHDTLSAISPLLDPVFLPNLHHLAMLDTFKRRHVEQLDYSRFTRLLAQLTTLYLTWGVLPEAPEWFHEAINLTLFNCDIAEFDHFTQCNLPVQHLRITGLFLTRNKTVLSMKFSRITAFIRSQSAITLRSLYLDAPFEVVPRVPAEFKRASQALIKVCEAKKVDLIFEEHPSDWQLDSVISEDFGKRQTESRKIKEVMEQGVAEKEVDLA